MVKKVWQTDRQTDGRTDRRTDWTSHIAAWSQLKNVVYKTAAILSRGRWVKWESQVHNTVCQPVQWCLWGQGMTKLWAGCNILMYSGMTDDWLTQQLPCLTKMIEVVSIQRPKLKPYFYRDLHCKDIRPSFIYNENSRTRCPTVEIR